MRHIIDFTELQNLRIENKGIYPSARTLTSDHLHCAWTLTVMVKSLPHLAAHPSWDVKLLLESSFLF